MTAVLSPIAKQQFFDNNGRPLVGGQMFVYGAGTTTKTDTFSDSAETLNTNPVILDYRGECNLWLAPNVGYKFTLAPATDTDPPTSPIWTVDNVVAAQLITLWGGVDEGFADTYILNFDAVFQDYTDGTVIYWLPANTNTGASTLNVNGLGAVPIVNQDGTALLAGQIIANSTTSVIYLNGSFRLLTSSTFAPVRRTAANAGIVTVETGQTTIVDLDLGTITEGQLFFVTAIVNMVKGGTAGTSSMEFAQAGGSGEIDFTGQTILVPFLNTFGVPIGNTWNGVLSAIGRATVSGTYTLRLAGRSLGSHSTVAADNGSLNVVVLG